MTPRLCHVPQMTISVTLRLCHLAHGVYVIRNTEDKTEEVLGMGRLKAAPNSCRSKLDKKLIELWVPDWWAERVATA
jgi:hypothetical protein